MSLEQGRLQELSIDTVACIYSKTKSAETFASALLNEFGSRRGEYHREVASQGTLRISRIPDTDRLYLRVEDCITVDLGIHPPFHGGLRIAAVLRRLGVDVFP